MVARMDYQRDGNTIVRKRGFGCFFLLFLLLSLSKSLRNPGLSEERWGKMEINDAFHFTGLLPHDWGGGYVTPSTSLRFLGMNGEPQNRDMWLSLGRGYPASHT